jgi:WD40 repeat protein
MYHKRGIESSPLQAYGSALLFSPTGSLIRNFSGTRSLNTSKIRPVMGDSWSACLQTLEAHSGSVNSVAFSHDLNQLASSSSDNTVKIWDPSSKTCLQTLKSHQGEVHLMTFSHDSTLLASGSFYGLIQAWDTSSGKCLQILEGHYDIINEVTFSHDSTQLASASDDGTIKIWDTSIGACLQTLDVGKPLLDISFNSTDTCLHTAISVVDISASADPDNTIDVTKPQRSQYGYVALSLDNAWITYNSKNLVWLPPEYRPFCSTVSGKMIGIATGTRNVWICNLELLEL